MSRATVLIIAEISEFYLELEHLLESDDIVINRAGHLQETPNCFEMYQPHLAVLDCPSGGVSGLALCQDIRAIYSGLLILVSDQEDSKFHKLAFDLGADASIVSIAGAPVLASNIQALLRRFVPVKASLQMTFASLTIDSGRRDVFIAGQAVELSTIEFQLFWSLAQKPGCVVSRNEIYRDIYNADYNGYDRSIDLYISRIRQKIGSYQQSVQYLKTVRGVGYQFVDDENG